ncbi:hypothetical protein BFW01_g469 [Lasiodiplodia theobromae]|nr:hypothetical protein BFW01_g469 [Lasiodiplodia theobromae]
MTSWKHLIRVKATDGRIYFASIDAPKKTSELVNLAVTGFSSLEDLQNQTKGQPVTVKEVLAPVPYNDMEIICIGVNYREHAEEASLTVPLDPVMWYKPKRALAGPGSIPIPKCAAEGFLDFEGELTIVTSKDARDVSVEDAPNYILGYTVGNDLTARMYQDPKRAGGQFTRCKAFDKFAPIGPVLTSPAVVGSVDEQRITTKVNGKVFQNSTCNLIHGPAALISFLSRGTTLPAGSVILTGSPPGIGYFQDPKYSLKNGDVVEIEISSIGVLENTVVFE